MFGLFKRTKIEEWRRTITADNLQNLGDSITLLGIGLSSTVVLAEIEVPLAALSETISAVGTVAEHVGNAIDGDFDGWDLVIDLGLNFVPNAYEKTFSTSIDELGELSTNIGIDNFLIEAWSIGSDKWLDFMNNKN